MILNSGGVPRVTLLPQRRREYYLSFRKSWFTTISMDTLEKGEIHAQDGKWKVRRVNSLASNQPSFKDEGVGTTSRIELEQY